MLAPKVKHFLGNLSYLPFEVFLFVLTLRAFMLSLDPLYQMLVAE